MAAKELAILLTAKNMASGPVGKVSRDLGTLNSVAGRAGAGMSTLGRNAKLAAAGIVAGLGLAVRSGIGLLAERENVVSATAAAIKATGGAARIAAPEVRRWSEELETATGAAVDDKAIQAAANTLLRFTTIGRENFQRTMAAAIDLGAAMKTGPEAAALTLGKALADPVKGMARLTRAGIVLTEAEQKRILALARANKLTEAQALLLTAIEARYKGAAAASAGPYQRSLNLLADTAEDAKMALAEGFLPVLERATTVVRTKLADPTTIASIRTLGQSIAGLFGRGLDAAERIPWAAISDAMRLAGTAGRAIFETFTGLPPWVQTAVLTGWGLNKLTGGAVSGIVGELGKGLIKGVLGMNAGVVNINAGVVNGGGLPGGGGVPIPATAPARNIPGGGGNWWNNLLKSIPPGIATGAAVDGALNPNNPIFQEGEKVKARLLGRTGGTSGGGSWAAGGGLSPDERNASPAAARSAAKSAAAERQAGTRPIDPRVAAEQAAIGRFTASTAPSMKSMEAHLANLRALQAGTPARDATNTAAIVAAITALSARIAAAVPTVNVSVTARAVAAATTSWRRTGRGRQVTAW